MQTPRNYKYDCRHYIIELLFQSIHALVVLACSIGIALTFFFRSSCLNLKSFEDSKFFDQTFDNKTISRLVTVVNEHFLVTFIYMLILIYGQIFSILALWATITRKKSKLKTYGKNLGLIVIISVIVLFVIIYNEQVKNVFTGFDSFRLVF